MVDAMTAATTRGIVTMQVVTSPADLDLLKNDWNRLHDAARGLVFQTFEWNRLWWELYGGPDELHIICLRAGDRLIGVVPFCIEKISFGICTVRRMKLLGTYEIYGEYAPLVHPDYEEAVAESVSACCRDLIGSGTCDILEFFRFTPDSRFMQKLLAICSAMDVRTSYDPECMARVQMELPRTWQEYLETISPSEKNLLGRREKSLTKQDVTLEVVKNVAESAQAFEDFVRLHTSSWSGRAGGGYFEQFSHFGEFHSRITAHFMTTGNARLYFYRQHGVRFAAVHAYFVHDAVCFYLSGLDREHALTKFSPGRVLLTVVIRHAIEEGYRVFDFQGGDEEYKFRLGGRLSSFAKFILWKKDSSFRVRVFFAAKAMRRILHDTHPGQMMVSSARRCLAFLRRGEGGKSPGGENDR